MPKNAQTTTQLHSSHMLINAQNSPSQPSEQYLNHEISDVQAGIEKAEEPEIKLPTSAGSWNKQESSRKKIYFCLFDCVHHNRLENSERDGNTRPPDLPLKKSVCRSGSNS